MSDDRRWVGPTIARLLVAAIGCWIASPALAAPSEVLELRLARGPLRMQIVALRPDIVRVRAGIGHLPEDASWAVAARTRAQRVPLQVFAQAGTVVLRTATLEVRVDRRTLHLTVLDRGGRVVLDDMAGAALSFHGAAFTLRKRMPTDAHYFGLGDKAGPLDRRGGAFTLWNTDAYGFGEATDPLYKSIPFVLEVEDDGSSVGVFLDNTWRSHFDVGRAERDTLRIGAEGGPVDYYVLAASQPKGVIEAYAYLTGTTPLPPIWTLGFQQSKNSYLTDAEVRSVAARLRAERIPVDAIYLDIDFQQHNRPFTVSREAFPDLPRLLADLKAINLNVVLITDLHIAQLPSQGYAPYDTGLAQDAFVRRPDRSTYVAEVWPGPAVFPDFSRPTVRDWWGGLYAQFVHDGVAGFWNDMNEPAIFGVRDKTMPLDVVHRIGEPGFRARAATHAEMHNVYGMLNSRATYEGLRRLDPDQRPFVLTRASYAGGQRYAATWTGDNVSSWGHLHLATAMLVNLGLSGFGLAGDDIGGYTGDGPSPELLTRWVEVGAFNPIFRDHAGKGKPPQEPFVGPADQVAIRRHYIEERYRLLPYLYGLAEQQSRTGLPIMRPVFLEFPEVLARGEQLGGTSDEFMLGPDLLVAPASDGQSPVAYRVSLPGPGWYDYWTGTRLDGAVATEVPRLERLPVYVRPGAILVRQPLVQSTGERPEGPLELAVYPGPDCHGELYFDDGRSMAFQAGEFLRRAVRCRVDGAVTTVSVGVQEGQYRPWWTEVEVTVHGVAAAPARQLVDGRAVSGVYEAATQTLRVRLADGPQAFQLRLEAVP